PESGRLPRRREAGLQVRVAGPSSGLGRPALVGSLSGPPPLPSPQGGGRCNLVIMEKTEVDKIAGWFAGRLPDGWFTGAPSVTVDEKQILVVGTLVEPGLGGEASAEVKAGAEAGRIARFREGTRGWRIEIAREAERQV